MKRPLHLSTFAFGDSSSAFFPTKMGKPIYLSQKIMWVMLGLISLAGSLSGQSINTGNVTTSPFCPGDAISIPFTVDTSGRSFGAAGGPAGGPTLITYQAQLSNTAGSFGSGTTNLASIQSLSGSNKQAITGLTINTTIPTGLPYSNTYRVRVIKTAPGTVNQTLIGTNITINPNSNGNLTIRAAGFTNPPPAGTICQGADYDLQFTNNNTFNPGNLFIAQLDNNINFTSPVNIGVLASTASSGTIKVVIPFTESGTGYYIRYIATNSVPGGFESCPSGAYTIPAVRPFTDPGNDLECTGGNASFNVSGGADSYQWQKVCSPPFSNITMGVGGSGVTFDIAKDGVDVFAATPTELSISRNSGATFTESKLVGQTVNKVFVVGNTVYAATNMGIFISNDNGVNFGPPVNTSGPNFLPQNNITALAVSAGVVYAGTGSAGLAIGTPGSAFAVRTTANGLGSNVIFDVFVDGAYVYVGTQGGLSVSSDGGASFVNYTTADGLGSNIVYSVFQRDNIVYAGTDFGFAYATSYNNTPDLVFTNILGGLGSPIVRDIFVSGSRIYAATTGGLSVANVGSTAFTTITVGLVNPNVYGVKEDAGTVYLATLGGVAFTTFTTMNVGGGGTNYNFTVTPADSWCRFQVVVNRGGCTLISNQVRVADIPPNITAVGTGPAGVGDGPTTCGGVNGEIKISGLVPLTKYRLVYTGTNGFTDSGDTITANAQGEFLNTLFPAGSYDLSVQSLVNPPVPACFSNTVNVILNDPLPPSAVTANLLDASICAGENITVNLPSALANTPGVSVEQYKWYTDLLGTTPANPATTTALTYSPAASPAVGTGSIFVRKRDVVTLCDGPMLTLNYAVNPRPSISHAKTDPSSAVATDGSITISLGANPGTAPFTLQYTTPANVLVTVNNATFPQVIAGLGIGNYTMFSVTNSEGCQSNIIASCPLLPPPPPDVIGGKVLQTVVCEIPGTAGGYFQQAEEVCASDQLVDEGVGSIAVGRIRRTSINPVNDEKVEMRGFVQFDLNAFVPKNATIEKIEYRPTSLTGGFQQVCEVDVVNTGATGDIQFDITQVKANNYAPYIGYQQSINDDLYDVKYNDFVIAKDAIGALTDLGPQGVIDAQQRLNDDGIFQVGLALSGNDFDLPVYQFHGMVFAPSGAHTLCITYTLKDYGDLPEPKFATDLAGGLVGPSHRIDLIDTNTDPNAETFEPAMFIGLTPPDGEADGQPSVFADGDNNDDVNDEDINSAWFTNPATDDSLIAGNTITLSFPVTNNLPGPVNVIAFFDWNNNGVFENDTERYSTTAPNGASTVTFLDLQIPIYATGNVGVRVRMTSGAVFDAYGPAPDGEVEDYLLRGIAGFDYADLPDSEPTLTPGATGIGNYETIFAIDGSRGPRHLINPNLRIGNTIDAELDGQPQANAFGDDINGIDDEDGVIQPDSVVRGKPARFRVFVTNKTMANAYLMGFVDWNNDGSFEDASPNQKSGPITIAPGFSGYYDVIFQVPVNPNPLPERVASRFRLFNVNNASTLLSTGPAQGVLTDVQGEVEDSWVTIVGYDWGDLGEPRYITDAQGGQAGPSHKIYAIDNGAGPVTSLYIGATPPDAEPQGNPNQPATGDDNNGIDDEDLSPNNFLNPTTLLPYPLIATDSTVLRIPVTNNFLNKTATLWAFIDWNGDGQFNGVTETYQRTVPAGFIGNVNMGIRIPNIALSDSIGVRIRITSGNILDAYGQAPDGEVEDFMVELRGAEYGDLPDATAGTGNNDYQTRRVYNGPRHGVPVTPLVFMGKEIDTEADGQPTERANGDDNNQIPDDEDGIVFLGPLVPGSTSQLSFSGTNNTTDTATLHIWADWNSDGILEYVDSVDVGPTTTVAGQIVNFNVPANATFAGGKVFFRFRFTTDTIFNVAPSPNGSAADGEVEDYFLPIFKMGNLVWEDRNHNGLQDAEEINLGIENVRVVLRFGGVDPITGRCDSVNQNTATNPNTIAISGGTDLVRDSILQVFTDSSGLYCFTGLIEGVYQIIAVDTFGLTPTRFDYIKNVTEEDLDSDGKPLKNPWDYVSGDRRQSKSQMFKLKIDQIGTDEEGILDQGNPQLLDPNAVGALPDDRVEQRIDFGYVGLDLGDLAESGSNPSLTNFITSENGTKPEGPKHIVTPDLKLGTCQDVEWQGQPDQDAGAEFKPAPDAGGDDPIADFSNYPNFPYDPSQGRRWPFHDAANACGDDEDGIRFLTPMIAGYDAIISVKYAAKINLNGPDAYLHAWFDWNGDGNFDNGAGVIDANEHIIFYKRDGVVVPNMLEANTQAVKLEMSYLTSATDSLTLTFKVPANVAYNNGNILSRFRISFDPQLGPNGILAPSLNFPDPQPGAGVSQVPGGVIPYGEVEDYFISLSKVGNTVFEDRDYDGFQDDLEPGIANVPIQLQFAGADGILNSGDPYEFTYHDTTDANGRYFFCGLIGNVDPSGIPNPVYQLIVKDPAGMTATFNNPDPSDDACIDDNSNGDDLLIDNRITTDTFTITNPMMLCLDENERNDVGGLLPGSNLPPALDALNNFPDNQYDETRDFGYTGFDYGDLPIASVKPGSNYLTLRDSMNALFNNKFGARHAIQPRLYLGKGVDGELNGKPDDDAGSKAGGDDDDQGAFKKGVTADDETGVRLLSPLLPGEFAYIKVNYTSQDTTNGGYINRTAYLDAFIDWNGNGVMDIPAEKVEFTHQSTSSASPFSTNNLVTILPPLTRTATLPATGANGVDSTILAFRVPTTAVFDSGVVFMRFRLGWTNYAASYPMSFPNGLGADNNIFHMATSPYVKAYEPFNDVALPDVANLGRYPYPQGEVEDYGIPVAKIGNLSWFDHDVFGDQDTREDVVDSLHLVLIWGGVNGTTGAFDTVGYQTSLTSLGTVTDILYNRSIAPPTVGTYTPGALVKTGISPAADSGLYSFRGLIPGIYYVLPMKYFATDSASFVNAWPKHRVVTLQDNPGVSDGQDSDGRTSGVGGTSRGPGAFVKILDGNSRQPEVCVNDRPLFAAPNPINDAREGGSAAELRANDAIENGKRDADDNANPFTPAFFPDNQWDKSVDIGWVDEPNVEASMDIVGVNFPTSQICGNFNVITHLCVKNPQEVPLDSFQMFFNLQDAYGNALYTGTKPIITIVDSAFVTNPAHVKIRKSSLVNFKTSVNAKPKDLLVVNPNYNGTTDTKLLVPTSEKPHFLLRGDSILCVQIEFEIDPSKIDAYPWMLSASVTARAVGFNKATGDKRPLTDFRFFHPRFGKSIVVFDSTDEFDDPMPMAGLVYPDGGDGILFEGMVADRGLKGDYQLPYVSPNVTGRDKYEDEDDKAIMNDSCWINTKWNSGYKEFTIALDANCQAIVNADLLVPNFIAACGFDKYPMGSYYRVIIQDKWTEETLWASVDRVPFDVNKYLDRQLIYKVRSVANHCNVIWGPIIFTDKIPPVVTCPPNTSRKLNAKNEIVGTYTFVCTDIDSIYNVEKSWKNVNYPYYTGLATATDACGAPRLENIKDEIIYLSDCNESAANGYIYAQIRRTFIFIDRMGNRANCSQLINFYRPTIKLPDCKISVPNNKAKGDTLILPIDLVGKKYNIKESVPYFINGSGDTIYITGKDYCGFSFNYTDEVSFETGQGRCGKKIIRTWSIFDWCYGHGANYPNYLMQPESNNYCYAGSSWAGGRYTWQQTIIVGDDEKPIIFALDIDKDGHVGRFDPGPAPNYPNSPKDSTLTYDPDDVLIYSTSPMDCTGNFLFNRDHFKVIEQSDWCYDIRVVERVAILDLDERPTGKFEFKIHPFVKITGDCIKGYTVIGVPMKGDWFIEVRVYDACYSESTALIPVRIMDQISPVVICDDKLNITLDNQGNGFVAAKDLDEGSWDNCNKLDWVKVRRPVQDACVATLLKFPRVIDVNKNGKIDPYDPSKGLVDLNGNGRTNDDYDYIDLNSDRIPQLNEYFTIGEYFTKNKPAAGNGSDMIMTPLMDTVPFFCCDGGSLMVELWGADKFGNRNYCWNNIQLEDKTPLECIAPWEVSVLCTDKNLAFIDSKVQSAKIFGDVVISSGGICVLADTTYTVVKRLKCGAGTIERIWTLTKQTAHGPIVTTCKQIIRVLPVREYDICFPKDVDQRDCKIPVIDTTVVKEWACDILAVNVSDKRYDASDDECYKIFRTYTVIDWCAYDDRCGDPMAEGAIFVVERSLWENYGKKPVYVLVRDRDRDQNEEFWLSKDLNTNNEDDIYVRGDADFGGLTRVGTSTVSTAYMPKCDDAFLDNPYGLPVGEYYHSFMYTQIIKVYDEVPPVVTGDPGKFCIREGEDCLANIKMVVKATDNCTDVVTLETNMLMIAPFQTTVAGSMILYGTPRWSTKALGNGQFEINVSNLPQGKHDLIVVVRDECGNLSAATRIPFTVEDCKAPAPICINGLSTELMPDASGTGGMMTVWATDFVASKIYDCNGQGPETNGSGKLVTKYSINRVGSPVVESQTNLVFTCADAGKPIQIELHAWDNAGNHDFCVTFIDIQDNRQVCTPGNVNTGVISGLIATDESEPVAGVMVNVSGAATLNQPTANAGVFAFSNLVKGSDFTVSAQLDKDHINGVSTFDLVQIQKHILGVKTLEGPYRQIAADVNNSKSISTLDMIQIRKLILNIDDRFKSVPSWKFVDATYKFADAQNPFAAEFPEVVNVNDLVGNVKADFVAIKMGDVNGNAATITGLAATEIRADRQFLLAAEDMAMKAEGHYEVAIRAKDLRNIQGYQFTLNYDISALELEGIEYGVAKADNFGIFKERGAITTSWNLSSSLGAAGNEVLFTLKLKARTAVKLSEVLNISSQLTPAEAYDTQNEAIGVKLSFGAISGQDFAVLRQNTPNPFHDETLVGFYLPKAAKAVLTIRDTKGSLVYRTEGNFVKGENKVILKQADLRASGVLYYTLETADFTDTKKMILLNR
ncbi:GEVED domain-containing protein [Haliscomenobacter hydrossis]|uniref:Cellulosome anchoring protein cohesin region n=1 Tax=Haliscomenobacter hydrossis (strain ATCC 27775 / DSM 1100 / LMG 10767 / O) TaxID=760192 RepID=F4KW26_HALH1|nr:GEVED domain-containing protein [Haliscomenobacter hydrossis]AEE48224.1 cellulosome anchoring protein cohesin region [Haliscomenobacter hydrossis DSM 1100]